MGIMLDKWLQNPESMGAEAVEKLPQLIEQFPYCSAYRMLYCIALANTHSTQLNAELQKTACAMPDRTQLFRLVNNGEYEWISLMHQIEQIRKTEMQMETESDSFDLIDQYLNQQHLPDMNLDGLLNAVGTDFTLDLLNKELPDIDESDDSLIVSESSNKKDEEDQLIDQFLSADNNGELMVPKTVVQITDAPTPEPNLIREKAFLTESLAKLYVKQHKYEQALAIFSQLNLQYSGKSCNFADQIRYLEKIIAFQKELEASSTSEKK